METALKIQPQNNYAAGFSALFTSKVDNFSLNLAGASLVEVLQQHEKSKRQLNPKYSRSAVITMIKEICEMSSSDIMPMHVNGIFYDYLFNYLSEEKNLQTSTIKNYFDQISSSLDWASKYGSSINPGYRDYNVKVHENDKYALSIEEICMIRDFDFRKLTKNVEKKVREKRDIIVEVKRNGATYTRRITKYVTFKTSAQVPRFSKQHIEVLERVRDMFILSCCLFQRYSDMRKVCPDNFSEDRSTYRVTQQKTGSKATVVINEISVSSTFAREILEKYNYFAPYQNNINTYNRHLHEMLEIIGGRFDDEFVVEEKRLGEIKRTIRKLSKCITSHTARRTAITLATKTNNEFKIRKASGHRDGRSFSRYVILD